MESLGNGNDSLEAFAETAVFFADFMRQAIAEFLEEFAGIFAFFGPIG